MTKPPLKPALVLLSTVLTQGAFGNCLDSTAVGQIGTQPPCMGMLIVDKGMLDTAKNNGSYAITGPDNNVYTFGDSEYNVFTGQVTSLYKLFAATTFNGDIGYWDVSNVTSFRDMFQFNGVFNQDLSGWNVTDKATDLRAMFNHSGAVDQDFSGWDISNVTDFFATFSSDHSRWSPANYDATLNGWKELDVVPNLTLYANFSFYTSAGADARASLIAQSWSFDRDNLTSDTTPPSLTSSPENGATRVAVDGSITLSFSEQVTWLGNSSRANNNIVELIRSDDDVVIETFFVGTRRPASSFTLTPSSDLEESTNYHIKIRPNTFYDTSNNPYPGISDNTTLTFRTAPEAQSIQFTQPADDLITSLSTTLSATASSGFSVAFDSDTPNLCSITGNEVTYIAVGTCTITASQAGDTTYLAAPDVTRSFEISKATQAITFAQPANDVMTSNGITLTASTSSDLAVTYASTTPSVCTVVDDQVTYVAFGTCTITASQLGNSSYLPASDVTQSFQISKDTQTITFAKPADDVITAGGVTLTASASSDLAITYASTTPNVCTVEADQVTFVTLGTCTITASQAGDSTYLLAADVIHSFEISKATQAITFAQPANDVMTSNGITLTASASSGATVAYASTTSGVCSVLNDEVTYVAFGTCTITASQLGNSSYLPASDVTQSFQISKDTQTITFAQPADDVMTSGGVTLTASASSDLAVTYASTTPNVCTVEADQVTFVTLGTCTITASQGGDVTYEAAPEVQRSFNVADADSDGDGILDSEDKFSLAKTKEITDGVILETTPASADSSCSIETLTVDSVATEFPGVAIDGSGVGVSFSLSGCDTNKLETLAIQIDLGLTPAKDSVVIAIDGGGIGREIAGATIEGSNVVYQITDNGPLDQATEAGKVLHLMTVAVPFRPLPVPALQIWALLFLIALLGFLGYRRLLL